MKRYVLSIRPKIIWHFMILGLISIYAEMVWSHTGTDGVRTSLLPDDTDVVFQGEKIYQTQCAACHGENLQGQPNWRKRDDSGLLPAPPHDKTGHTWHHSDDLLFEITKFGPAVAAEMPDYQSNMPAYEKVLDDNEIIAVLSYIKSTWPSQEREWQSSLNGDFSTQEDDSGIIKELLKSIGIESNKHSPED